MLSSVFINILIVFEAKVNKSHICIRKSTFYPNILCKDMKGFFCFSLATSTGVLLRAEV